jgi:hypothetical protein
MVVVVVDKVVVGVVVVDEVVVGVVVVVVVVVVVGVVPGGVTVNRREVVLVSPLSSRTVSLTLNSPSC